MPSSSLRILLIFSILCITITSIGQSEQDTTKQKADLEFTLMGGSVSLFKRSIDRHTFGVSIGLLTYGYMLFDNPARAYSDDAISDSRGLWEYAKIKLFYRYKLSKRIFLQTAFKGNYVMLGENVDPTSDILLGLESSFIYKFGRVIGYKADISTVASPKDGKFYVFINPLILCFNF